MNRKRRGSASLGVVVIFSLIMLVGSSMISMTVGDYRLRINESNKIKNLYGSVSGLDASYDIIVKTFDGAAKFGILKADELNENNVKKDNKSAYKFVNTCYSDKGDEYLDLVRDIDECKEKISECNKNKKEDNSNTNELNKKIKEYEKKIEEDNKKIEEIRDYEFKRSFKNFIYFNGENRNIIDAPSILMNSIKNLKYVTDVKRNENDNDNEIGVSYSNVELENRPNVYIPSENSDKDEKGINLSYDGKSFEINVKSEFYTNPTDEKVGKSKKIVQSTYVLNIPERKDVDFSEEEGNIPNYKALSDKAIIVNKNMQINNSDNCNIKGNVYICGDDSNDTINKIAYSKYIGGIQLENSKNVSFNGNVITSRTFNTKSNVDCTIDGNLYAKNVYAGKENGEDGVENSNVTITSSSTKSSKEENNKNDSKDLENSEVNELQSNIKGQAIIDNDITLKADNSNINIDEFYGINDKNIGKNESEKEKLNATSSSILVNGNYSSSVKINKSAYIMGVANIDTKDGGYVTGESTGVKGNYIAYAPQARDDIKSFSNHDPLFLLNSDSIEEKSKRFIKYWQGDNLKNINSGGIELPDDIHSAGAIVYKDSQNNVQVKDGNISFNDQNEVKTKRDEYASIVYSPIGSDKSYEATYKPNDVLDEIIDFDNEDILKDYNVENTAKDKEKLIFNEDENRKIVIEKNSSIRNDYEIDKSKNEINIKTKTGDLNAVVVTNGDIEFKDNIKFKGIIICNKNLIMDSAKNTSIEYDKSLVKRIQSNNKDLFNKIFISEYEDDSTQKDSKNNEKHIVVNYDVDKFIKNKVWRIIQ